MESAFSWIFLVAIAIAFLSMASAGAQDALAPVRNLTDYPNADGSLPDGLDNGVDDTSAVDAALAVGPGVVRIPAGHFRFADVTIPPDVTLIGAGRGTVIHKGDAATIFRQDTGSRWILRDMVLHGGAEGDWKEREDLGHSGVFVKGSTEWEISGLVVRNTSGAGIRMLWVYSASPWKTNGTVLNVQAVGNYVGIRFDERAEYINASALGCWENVIGCVIHGGNVKITNSNFNSNLTGLLIDDKSNGSHGSITNCLINHNLEYSLVCRNVANGMLIDACCFFDGTMLIEDCVGVSVTSGIISCPVKVTGDRANRIADNYVIPKGRVFDVSPSTIVQNNFTADGPADAK